MSTQLIDRTAKRLASNLDTLVAKRDDGRDGVSLVSIQQGGLVPIPFSSAMALSASSGASIALGGSTPTDSPLPVQPLAISIPAGSQGYAYFRTEFDCGRRLGLMLRRHNATPQPLINVVVDGDPRPQRMTNTRFNTIPFGYGNAFDSSSALIVAEDLSPGPHSIGVFIAGDATQAWTNVTLMGWAVDEAYAFKATNYQRFNVLTRQALSTTPTVISATYAKRLRFSCSGTTDRTVILASGATEYIRLKVPAGSFVDLPFDDLVKVSSYSVSQDIGTDVTLTFMAGGFTG